MLEDRRMARRLRREREGRPLPPVPAERYPQANRHWRMPVEPVLALIDARLAETGLSEGELAKLIGASDKFLRRLRSEQRQMTVDMADRIAVALGSHLDLLEAS
jgi:antitoxin component HigA of HigAB toxin-antitoxin module